MTSPASLRTSRSKVMGLFVKVKQFVMCESPARVAHISRSNNGKIVLGSRVQIPQRTRIFLCRIIFKSFKLLIFRIYFKNSNKKFEIFLQNERLPLDLFTRRWCQMKGNSAYICTFYLRFRCVDDKYS
jgi:hypothetical protein